MDKSDFVKSAPGYYALAIAKFMRANYQSFRDAIVEHYGDYLLGRHELFVAGLEILLENGVVEIFSDDFAPPVLKLMRDHSIRSMATAGVPQLLIKIQHSRGAASS